VRTFPSIVFGRAAMVVSSVSVVCSSRPQSFIHYTRILLKVTAARACDARKPWCVKIALSLTVKQSQSLSFLLAGALSHTHKHKHIYKHASTYAHTLSQSLSLTPTHKPHTGTVANSTVIQKDVQPGARGHLRRQIYHASWL